jgi:O-antigen/teichoic acid export membrane protein
MIDNLKNTIKGAFIYGFGNLSTKLIGFILIPLYTKKFTVAEYGILGILDITSQVIIVVFGLSLYTAFFRWYWDKDFRDKQKSIFFTLLVSVSIFSLILGSVLITIRGHLSSLLLDSPDYSYYIVLIIVVACLEAVGVIIATLLRLQEKAVFYTTLYILKLLTSLVFTVYFIVYRGKNIESIYEAQIIGNVAYLLTASLFVLKNIEFRFDRMALRNMLIFSLPLKCHGPLCAEVPGRL